MLPPLGQSGLRRPFRRLRRSHKACASEDPGRGASGSTRRRSLRRPCTRWPDRAKHLNALRTSRWHVGRQIRRRPRSTFPPIERDRVGDRDEPEVTFRQPLPKEPERLGIAGGFLYSTPKQLPEAVPKFAGERHARIVDLLVQSTGDPPLRCASVRECHLGFAVRSHYGASPGDASRASSRARGFR